MKRGLKAELHAVLYFVKLGSRDFPDEEGTERKELDCRAIQFSGVPETSPMKRGLKERRRGREDDIRNEFQRLPR